MKTNVTYIVSRIDHAVAFEWIVQHLNTDKFNLSFILLDCTNSGLERFLQKQNIVHYHVAFTSKKDYPNAILQTRKMLKKLKSTVVHCHMRDANMIGLSAAKSLGIKHRIFTRHYSTYNHEYHPKSVKVDKVINAMATQIVAISEVVKRTLIEKEKVSESKVVTINHGFDLNKFSHPVEKNVAALQQKYESKNNRPVIGVIARYISWKGYQYIVPALGKIVKDHPKALIIFANANGPYKETIRDLIAEHIPNNVVEIAFEKDLFSLYQLFDVYVHTPISEDIEAFGQTYVEALAAGIPSVFSMSGIAHEFIKDSENALVVDYQNSDQIFEAVKSLLSDDELKNKLIKNGQASVSNFSLNKFICKLEELYA